MTDRVTPETVENVRNAVQTLRDAFDLHAVENRAFAREAAKLHWLSVPNYACRNDVGEGVETAKHGRSFVSEPVDEGSMTAQNTVAYLNTPAFSVGFRVRVGQEQSLFPVLTAVTDARQKSSVLKQMEPFDRGNLLAEGLAMLVRAGSNKTKLRALQGVAEATTELDGIQALVTTPENTLLAIVSKNRTWVCDAAIDFVDPDLMEVTVRKAPVSGRNRRPVDRPGGTIAEHKLQSFDVLEEASLTEDEIPF